MKIYNSTETRYYFLMWDSYIMATNLKIHQFEALFSAPIPIHILTPYTYIIFVSRTNQISCHSFEYWLLAPNAPSASTIFFFNNVYFFVVTLFSLKSHCNWFTSPA